MLELDYTNVLDSTIGLSHGIPKIAFDKVSESSRHIVEHIHKAHESAELGFGVAFEGEHFDLFADPGVDRRGRDAVGYLPVRP